MGSASATILSSPSGALAARFAQLRAARRKALVCYTTGGHPDRGRSIALLREIAAAGADVLEVGIPFSDPLADGPVIQGSSQAALAAGTTLDDVLDMVHDAAVDVPVVLFGYLNPFLSAGSDVLERARAAGCAGVLVTDLPVGADPSLEEWFASGGLDFVRLVAPTTPEPRMREIGARGSGFVYLISRLGVTGERAQLAADLPQSVARIRRATALPVCVGFGVSTPAHAAAVAGLADGVVVGTAIVRAAEVSVDAAATLVRGLRTAVDAAAGGGAS